MSPQPAARALGQPRRRPGAPALLVANLAVFALAVYAFSRVFAGGEVVNYLTWFLGAAILHDLLLLPLYSALDRVFGLGLRRAGHSRLINHLRIPALLSGLLLLVYSPLILGLSSHTYTRVSGHAPAGYLRNWLLITAGMFAVSGALLLRRRWRSARTPAR